MFDEFCKKVGLIGMNKCERLLDAYKELWSNRSFSDAQVLEEAIRIELKDELTHPRTRKSLMAKYFLAIKRISGSSLNDSEKMELIDLFNSVLEQLLEEDKKKADH